MNYKTLDNILSDAVNDSELCCDDIPEISLYLDQIIHLIPDRPNDGLAKSYSRTLTKAMVNNYSKAGLISPIVGKKYTKEQIVQLLMINSLKNVYSISEIKGAMDAFYSCEGVDSQVLMDTYDNYVELRRKSKISCPETVKEMIEVNGFDVENQVDYFNAILGVVAMADYFDCIAHAMLDAIIPPRDEDDENTIADAIKESEKELKKGARAIKKEVKRENKAHKKAEKALKTDEPPKKSVNTAIEAKIADELMVIEKEVDRALDSDEDDGEA